MAKFENDLMEILGEPAFIKDGRPSTFYHEWISFCGRVRIVAAIYTTLHKRMGITTTGCQIMKTYGTEMREHVFHIRFRGLDGFERARGPFKTLRAAEEEAFKAIDELECAS